MTNIELWDLNRKTVTEAFAFAKAEHKKEKCINWKKDNSFCECFNFFYTARWQEILKNEV